MQWSRRPSAIPHTLAVLLALLSAAPFAQAQSPTQPTREYVRAGGKLIAIEIPGTAGSPVSVSISPTAVSLGPSGTQNFAATVTGTSNTAVTWTHVSGLGTLSSSGSYTAPASISASSTATVRATSVADNSKSATATVTLVPPPPPTNPVITGFTPLNQSGYDVTFSMLAQGASYPVDALQLYIDNTLDATGGCLVWYQQSDGRLYLGGDAYAYYWVGSVALNSSEIVQNSQCTLYGSGSSRSISGNNTSLNIHVQFKGAFAGVKQIYTWLRNSNNQAVGWNQIGTWTVAAPPSGVSPASGSTFPNQILQLSAATNPPGAGVSWTLSPSQGSITNDGLYKAPSSIASQQTVTATARYTSTQALIGTATITLKPISGGGTVPRFIYSLPTDASGFADVFRFNWRDDEGPNTIDEARVRFSTSNSTAEGTNANICAFRWTRAQKRFELYNNAGTGLSTPIFKGGPDTENAQCKLIAEGINWIEWGGHHFEIQVGIGFKTPFASGTKYIQMWARDNTGRESQSSENPGTNWENVGTWGFAANTTSPNISTQHFSPSPGSYTSAQTFRVTATDASGRGDIDAFQFVIGNTANIPSPNTCHFYYFRDSNYAVLLDNNPALWAGVSEIVWWGYDLNNSQCTVKLSQSQKGDDLAVTNGYFLQPRVEIKTPFLGTRSIWVLAVDNAGNHSGFQYMGQFNFTSAGVYDLEMKPYYQRDPATGKREMWLRVEARQVAEESPAAGEREPKPEAR